MLKTVYFGRKIWAKGILSPFYIGNALATSVYGEEVLKKAILETYMLKSMFLVVLLWWEVTENRCVWKKKWSNSVFWHGKCVKISFLSMFLRYIVVNTVVKKGLEKMLFEDQIHLMVSRKWKYAHIKISFKPDSFRFIPIQVTHYFPFKFPIKSTPGPFQEDMRFWPIWAHLNRF